MFRYVLLVAFALRLGAYLALGGVDYPLTTDPGAYAQIAENVRAGHGLLASSAWGQFRALYAPLYPLLLALLGPLLNPLIDAGMAYTLVRLGEALGSRRNGTIAAALYLLWPVPILLTATPQKEMLALLLAAQAALAVVRLRRELSSAEIVRLGLCAGLLALTQPAFAPFPAIALLLLKRDARAILGSAAIALLVLTPWWVRNWLVFHSFVPLTTATGYNLLVAVTGYYAPMKPFMAMGELAGSRAALHAALGFAAEHPGQVVAHRLGSSLRALAVEGWPAVVLPQLAILRPLLEAYWLAIAGAGLWAAFRLRAVARELKLLLAACLVQFAIFNLWFEFGERHRYLIVPFLILAASSFAESRALSGGDKSRRRSARPRSPAAQ
jgi:hypothetical protein